MAASRQTTAELIKPLGGAFVRRGTLGATTVVGEIVELQSDGKYDPAAASAAISNAGIALNSGGDGDPVDIVFFGPVSCLTGATVGAEIYVTDTAGEPGESAGTNPATIGFAESATVLFVNFYKTI
jgi:hypothetical protein